jgi:hypothetical protein
VYGGTAFVARALPEIGLSGLELVDPFPNLLQVGRRTARVTAGCVVGRRSVGP